MATYTVRQVLPQSVDDAGVSTATTTLDTTDPRTGQIYSPTALAAAAPVWFHRLPDGRHVGLFARRLTQAVLTDPQPGGPLLYSAATDVYSPAWAVFDPASGAVSAIAVLPTDTEGDRVLRAAASRGNYLFTLSTIGEEALLQHFRVDRNSALILQAEEIVPGGLGLGLHVERNDLWVFGAKDGKLALARKNWGRVGENSSINPFLRWRYRTERGWSFDLDDLEPLAGNIPTSGPVSVARDGMRYYLTMPVYTPFKAATAAVGTTPASPEVPAHWDAKTWTARAVDRKWTPHPFTVPLGGDLTYIGGTAQLQPQLTLTAGYTSTETHHGQTVLDGGSDAVQVFTGLASQVVRLPDYPAVLTPAIPEVPAVPATETTPAVPAVPAVPATYRAYTVYNKTVASDLIVQTATGQPVATLGRGRALTFAPTVDNPLLPGQWEQSTPEGRNPPRRSGFPYLTTVGLRTAAGRTLVTSWGVFEV